MFVIHSFKFKKPKHGETDFVIVSKKHGVIFMEVKAVTSSKYIPNRINKAEEQIKKAQAFLSTYLKDEVSGDVPTALFNNPAFVVLPNGPRPEGSTDAYKNVCFQVDCKDSACFREWWDKSIGCVRPLNITEEMYKCLLCKFVGNRCGVKAFVKQVDDTTRDVLQMFNNQQLALLSKVGQPLNQLITGPAGSGKTEILLHKVQALDTDISKTGKEEKILVLCYNKPLRGKLAKVLEKCHSVTVKTFDSIMNLSRMSDKIPTFDHIFVDEGQDLVGDWRKLLDDIQAESRCEKKFRWVFFDNDQRVHICSRGLSDEDLDRAFKLSTVYRMTRSIFEEFKKYMIDPGEETQYSIGHDIKGRCIIWDKMDDKSNPAESLVACEYISNQVKRLLEKELVRGKDICVLLRTYKDVSVMMIELTLMGIEYQNAEDSIKKPVKSAIIVDSIRRFKGLETKVLILYDPPGPGDDNPRELLNTALSRSFCHVIIIATEEDILRLQSDVGLTPDPQKSPKKTCLSISPRKTDLVEAAQALYERFMSEELTELQVDTVDSIL
ncbi:SLFN5 [Branchiostoma lanceolatum]|uniref:SLFN5 protein n=1 Tax=Branchiostoma lanceolatum TaxID=7740 RepID=A0A8K0ACV4_BRALA|nr:SLFN5 [Branchiostoma lanceolatum]